jgi:hypothetical protein
MGVITTIPTGAKYFYLALCKYVSSSSNITSDPCDVVLHKGSNYASGDYMTADNAKDWIADMEPDWVQSDEVWIAAGKAATDSTSLGLYSPFNGNYQPARGGSSGENDLSVKGNWFQYSMREAAANRGMMLIDYEASKLIAMLFMAKYGRRNSQGQLGSGSDSIRYIGNTRAYGIQDTCVPAGTSGTTNYSGAAILKDDGTYVYPNSPNFLGIEDVHGSVYEFLDRAYYANETAADASKIRITNPDLTTRRLYCPLTSATYPRSLVHGKYCDIAACSTVAGSNSTYYPDQQVGHPQVFTTWKIVRCIRRSDNGAYTNGGVFYLNGSSSVGNSYGDYGSRLMFRGNINKTTDIDTFMKATDWRG